MADRQVENLFDNLPSTLPEELVEVLAQSEHVRIERIISTGHSSPEGFWYDQDQSEWVMVLKGEAKLLLEGDDQPILLQPGDHILIPPHRKHRVVWTTPDEQTVWLAVFYS
jgi:cupin 2 domain-containing protein